jgi:hypothetical protein
MDTPTQYRQGDVLIEACVGLPPGVRTVAREDGRIVLAHGEVTGHAHAIVEPDVEMYEMGGNYYIRVPRQAVVQHEEHHPIPLDAGTYRIVRQREYVPGSRPFDPLSPQTSLPAWESSSRGGWSRFVMD